MLNKKFASIRATANVKTEQKRSSVASSSGGGGGSISQRLSQSQSMEMYGMNYQTNNEMLMSMSKNSPFDQRTSLMNSSSSSTPGTPLRSAMILKNSPHPYVNLMHQQYQNANLSPHQHLQYQNSSNNMSFGSPIIFDSPNGSQNQSWISSNQASPLVTHYTAAQIYMRPKNLVQPQHSPQQSNQQLNTSPMVAHRKQPPPEVPKRLSSTVSTTSANSLKKSNGLSRSGMK